MTLSGSLPGGGAGRSRKGGGLQAEVRRGFWLDVELSVSDDARADGKARRFKVSGMPHSRAVPLRNEGGHPG